MKKINRREFILYSAGGLSALLLAGNLSGCVKEKSEGLLFFTQEEFRAVELLMGRIIPETDTPGAKTAGAALYLDRFLGAFMVEPPLIYAGGPYSGRFGDNNSFSNFIPLSRIEEIAWRTIIEGSQGIPEREFNGPVKGLQEIYRSGISVAFQIAKELFNKNIFSLSDEQLDELIIALKEKVPEFIKNLILHTYEGTYSAPEYGGNRDLSGWKAINYPGDVQPLGYNQKEMEEPDDPSTPPELTLETVNQFLIEYIKQSGGLSNKKFPGGNG